MVYDGLPALDLWTIETVEEVVRTREFEPSRFDYKEVLVPERGDEKRREEHRLSIRKTVCAMANGQGGLILFGVADRKADVALPEARIVGIHLDHDLVKEFGDQAQHIEPELHFQVGTAPIRLRDDASRGVFIVSIEESSLRPHMVMPEHIYYRRGDGGQNVKMKHDEVRDQMLLTQERLAKVLLFRIRLVRFHRLAVSMHSYYPNYYDCLERFEVAAYDALLPDVISVLPLDYLLDRLMTISERANLVNATAHRVILQIGLTTTMHRGRGDVQPLVVRSALLDIQRNCREAEERLGRAFGPLPAGYELRYESSA